MMRCRLAARANAGRERAPQVVDRLARREMHQVHRLPGVAGEVEVARDHQALAERRPAAEAELRSDRARVRVPAARQRLLLAVHGDHAPGDRVVLQRAPHHARRCDRPSVVGEPGGPRVGERAHLRQLRAVLTLRDRSDEPDRNVRLGRGARDAGRAGRSRRRRPARCSASRGSRSSRPQQRPRSRSRSSLRPRDPGVRRCTCGSTNAGASSLPAPPRSRGARSCRARSPICGDHPAVDPHVERSRRRLRPDRARARRGSRCSSLPVRPREHHATPTADSTATGPVVSRS